MITERDVRERLGPLIRAKVEVYNRYNPNILVSPDGDILVVTYSPEMAEEMRNIDDLIDLAWKAVETNNNVLALMNREFEEKQQ